MLPFLRITFGAHAALGADTLRSRLSREGRGYEIFRGRIWHDSNIRIFYGILPRAPPRNSGPSREARFFLKKWVFFYGFPGSLFGRNRHRCVFPKHEKARCGSLFFCSVFAIFRLFMFFQFCTLFAFVVSVFFFVFVLSHFFPRARLLRARALFRARSFFRLGGSS